MMSGLSTYGANSMLANHGFIDKWLRGTSGLIQFWSLRGRVNPQYIPELALECEAVSKDLTLIHRNADGALLMHS